MRGFILSKLPRIAGAVVLAAGLTAGLGVANKAQAWSLGEAAKPYAGTEVRVICDGYAPCMAYVELTKKFEDITGIKVNIEIADLQAIQTLFLTDQITKAQYYDLVEVVSWSTGVYPAQGFVFPYSHFTDNPNLKDPNVNLAEDLVPALYAVSTKYDGIQYSTPTKFVLAYMVYRHDLITDEERVNFKAKYGYDLPEPPTEWQHYYDVSEFYTRKPGEKLAGEVLDSEFYGTIAPFKRHLTVLYDYERILLGMGGKMVNEDWTVAIDQGDAAVKALEFYLSLRPFSTPGYMEATWDDEYINMCNGTLFIMFSWGDTTPFLEIPEDCPASAGNMTYFPHPGTHLTPAEANNWMIPKSAQNPDAAWLFVQWLQTREIQIETMPMGGNPTRSDVIRMKEWQDPDWPNRQREEIEIWLEDNDLLYVRPNPPHWLAWQDIIMEEMSAAGADMQDAETTIANIARRMREAAGEQ